VKRAALPIFAALGGMLVPALIFYCLNIGTSTASGWGIPMATDIAFALAVISMLGNKIPLSLKIFLSALAIVDDLGAILVIAIFYTKQMHFNYLLIAGGIFVLLLIMNALGVRKLLFYIIPGFFLWYCIHHSGIHATIAGVLLAICIPTNPVKTESPLENLEHKLMAPVNYLIMPLFALANTNIRFHSEMIDGLKSSLGLGIICGLLIGKPLGISLFSYLAVKFKLSRLPNKTTWKHIFGAGILAGIGFTMSVFIALLSFDAPELHEEAKFAILIASLIAGILGYFYLSSISKRNNRST
jgi:NhaA family Na+:H+ antiporter